jgi:two-component system, OmpR family, osmolarity sensor histidine kinase EnvZ
MKVWGTVTRWFDTLFARVLLVQAAVVLVVVLLFGSFALRQQAQALARAVAPDWAAALKAAGPGPLTSARVEVVSTRVHLLPGPPPSDAAALGLYPRFRVLADALRAQGLPVRGLAVSGRTGEAITWLELQQGGATQWVGVRGELEGLDLRERGSAGLLLGLLATLAAAWFLSRRVVRPLADLQRAMRQFEADGQLPPPVANSAPLELRELAQQLAKQARMRRDLDAQRRSMLAAISHDLRSPLGRIRLAAELLPSAEGVAKRQEVIVRNVQVADRLLGSFIDMARAEEEPLNGRVDLAALCRELAQDQADVHLHPGSAQPVWLQPANALALERALNNLLDNARLHGAAPIELALNIETGHALLMVRDHGPGITPAARDDMLQPFTRGESSRQTPGTGLGLAIVQRTALRHGGTLELGDAQPGLRVVLRLPLAGG